MKYKVGDKVRVREDLEVGKRYGITMFTNEKAKHKGEILEIFDILKQDGVYRYRLVDSSWYSPEMLRPAELKIWCETEEEKQEVLEELEKEGYEWSNSNKKPTEYINDIISYTYPMGFYLREDRLSYSTCKDGFDNQSMEEFTPSEFTGIDFSEKIIITKTLTGATATYGDKTATEEGEFEDASRQALAEVLCPFKVGDNVKVKPNEKKAIITKIRLDGNLDIEFCDENFNTIVALERLEPCIEPLYNAKLFCVKGSRTFNKGYIYEVKDGKFIDEYLTQYKPYKDPYKDLENVNSRLAAQFMEVKGGLDD